MQAGDSQGNIFTLYSLPKDMNFKDPRFEFIWGVTAKYGTYLIFPIIFALASALLTTATCLTRNPLL